MIAFHKIITRRQAERITSRMIARCVHHKNETPSYLTYISKYSTHWKTDTYDILSRLKIDLKIDLVYI